jgi:penicillin-binding protein 1C
MKLKKHQSNSTPIKKSFFQHFRLFKKMRIKIGGIDLTVTPLQQKVALGIGLASIIIVAAYIYIFRGLPNPRGLKNYQVIPISSLVLDRKGELLYEIFNEQNRTPVHIKDLPDHVKYATIAIEDADFYKHNGISIVGGMLRALKDTLVLHQGTQGGSTITQQLIKSALLTPERTIQRKIKEIVLALWVEQIMTKDEILELYLNQVPYGGVSYGIQEASKTFFDKDAKELTLAEAALLARLPQRPSYFSPHINPERAKRGQEAVLKRMEDLGYITEKERKAAEKEELKFHPPANTIRAPHFVFYVRDLLEKQFGKDIIEQGGLKVFTTLDTTIQASAEAAVNKEVSSLRRLKVSNGAALVTRPSSGEILAMVGSADFFATGSGTFNVTTALRQPGSSIKPLNYAIGIERGLVTAATIFNDIPTCFAAPGQPKSYCPVNYDGKYRGPTQLRSSLGNSLNIPAVKMLALNGVKELVASASAFTIGTFTDPARYGLSLTLGGGEVRMTEMAQAFSAFANEGIPKTLIAIRRIEDKNGKVLYEYKDPNSVDDVTSPLDYPDTLKIQGRRAISKDTAFIISHILQDNGARTDAFGGSSSLVIPKKTVSVKTGTTNDLRDNWTIGYTPNFLVATWVGNNDNSSMSRVVSGVTGAAPIWNSIMRSVLANQPDLPLRRPEGVVGKQICLVPTSQADPSQPQTCQTRFEFFRKGILEGKETQASVTKESIPINRDTGAMTTPDNPSVEMQEKTILTDILGTRSCLDCNQEGQPRSMLIVIDGDKQRFKEIKETPRPTAAPVQ